MVSAMNGSWLRTIGQNDHADQRQQQPDALTKAQPLLQQQDRQRHTEQRIDEVTKARLHDPAGFDRPDKHPPVHRQAERRKAEHQQRSPVADRRR